MMQVGIRELKAHLSEWLARAQAGETLDVTSRRKVVARIQGVRGDAPAGVDALLTTGEAEWHGGKPAGAAIQLSGGGHQLSEIVARDRG